MKEKISMKTFAELKSYAKTLEPKVIAIACAQDADVMVAVENARKEGVIKAILVGDQKKIEEIAKDKQIDLNNYELIDNVDNIEASNIAAKLVSDKKADILMKGMVDTSIVLKAVLNKELDLRTGRTISHCAVFETPGYDRLIYVTDAAMNLLPSLEQKVQIIENAVNLAHALGNDMPKVGAVCAKEKVDPKMQATVDAGELQAMNDRGEFKGCVVGGPFGLDNAVSVESAIHKGITNPIAGKCEILLTHNIEAGNALYKGISYFQQEAKLAGIVLGARAPIVLTSRSDSEESKFNSILLSVLYADKHANN